MEETVMGKFRFKEYTFAFNPHTFAVVQNRRVRTIPLVNGTVAAQELGFAPMAVTGEGELIGDDLMGEYQKLYELMLEKESGLLYLPDMTPFYCFLNKLSVIGKAGPRVLRYQFEFLEDCEKNTRTLTAQKPYYLTKAGDTLTLVAIKCGISLRALAALNPTLAQGEALEEGVMIWLR